jgi:hypothetical protein
MWGVMQAEGDLLPLKRPIPLLQALGNNACEGGKGLDFLVVVFNW